MCAGVVITHGSLAQAAYGYLCQFNMGNETVMLSFLPLAHIYEVTLHPWERSVHRSIA